MAFHIDLLDGLTYDAIAFRHPITSLLNANGGIIASGDLAVSAQSTPNMSVSVAVGSCWVPANSEAYQGMYYFINDAAYNVTIPAADSSPRIDLIVVQVTDPSVTGTGTAGVSIIDVTGTPASSPVAPATPQNALVLAQVSVAASATSISSSDITQETSPALFGLQLPYNQLVAPNNLARLYATAQTVISSGTATQVTGLAQDYAMGSTTTSNSEIVIGTTGIYQVSYSIAWQNGGGAPGSGMYLAEVYHNGSFVRGAGTNFTGGYLPRFGGSDLISCVAGDTLQLWGEQNSGANQATDPSPTTYISAVQVG